MVRFTKITRETWFRGGFTFSGPKRRKFGDADNFYRNGSVAVSEVLKGTEAVWFFKAHVHERLFMRRGSSVHFYNTVKAREGKRNFFLPSSFFKEVLKSDESSKSTEK